MDKPIVEKLRMDLNDIFESKTDFFNYQERHILGFKESDEWSETELNAAETTRYAMAYVILFAYYESFIKEVAKLYLNTIFKINTTDKVNVKILGLYFRDDFKNLRIIKTTDDKYQEKIEEIIENIIQATQNSQLLNEVKKESLQNSFVKNVRLASNMDPLKFQKLCKVLLIDGHPYKGDTNFLKNKLIKYRNKIAHGNIKKDDDYNEIFNFEQYQKIREKVFWVIEKFKDDLLSAAEKE